MRERSIDVPKLPLSLLPFLSGLGVSLACALGTARASAATTICHGPEVRADAHVEARWQAVVAGLRDELRAMRDIDPCGVVAIFGAGDALLVQVSLPDGRAAARRVSRPDELAATVGSLLLLPPGGRAQAVEGDGVPASPPPSAKPLSPEPQTPPEPRRSIDTRFEVGAGGAGRLSGGRYVGPGLALFAQLVANDWLLGAGFRTSFFEVRADDNPPGFHLRTSALAGHAGRRLHAAGVLTDVILGPSLVVEREEREAAGQPDESAGSVDVRLTALARVSSANATGLRLFGGLDLEASPGRVLGENRRPDPRLPSLPWWSAGVTVGILGALF